MVKKIKFDFQSGTGQRNLTEEERYFFDITGYLILEDILTANQLEEARESVRYTAESPPSNVTVRSNGPELELVNIIECGGVVEEAFAHTRLVGAMEELIWGSQFRLVASRSLIRKPGISGRITQGGLADPRRYARYRCFVEGEFRCLMVSCLVALDDTLPNDGPFCVIPASHKSNFGHPYTEAPLNTVSALRDVPLPAGSAVIFSESLSRAMKPSVIETKHWLLYQYGPSYMLNLPGCDPSDAVLNRASEQKVKAHLLMKPYYHPDR